MVNEPSFFVPAATDDNMESVYAEFAKICGRNVPDLDRRIYSITFVHDGVKWTATIGKNLSGLESQTTRKGGKRVERVVPVSDPAIVLAIFPGNPYMVVTNQNLAGNIGSSWTNPFMAGKPTSVKYFSEKN